MISVQSSFSFNTQPDVTEYILFSNISRGHRLPAEERVLNNQHVIWDERGIGPQADSAQACSGKVGAMRAHTDPTSCFWTPSKHDTSDVGLLLVHRFRRWTNIKPTLYERVVYSGGIAESPASRRQPQQDIYWPHDHRGFLPFPLSCRFFASGILWMNRNKLFWLVFSLQSHLSAKLSSAQRGVPNPCYIYIALQIDKPRDSM